MEGRKRQDLLHKLGSWEPWEMAEGEGKGNKGAEKIYSSIKNKKNKLKKLKCSINKSHTPENNISNTNILGGVEGLWAWFLCITALAVLEFSL